MSRKAMQVALEALESDPISLAWLINKKQAITALRQALVDADDTSQKCVDEMVKTKHDKQIEIAQAYERGWNAALAQQEPVAWMYVNEDGECEQIEYGPVLDDPEVTPLYTSPPKKEWVGMTDEELYDCEEEAGVPQYEISSADLYAFARVIEAKLREKNI